MSDTEPPASSRRPQRVRPPAPPPHRRARDETPRRVYVLDPSDVWILAAICLFSGAGLGILIFWSIIQWK